MRGFVVTLLVGVIGVVGMAGASAELGEPSTWLVSKHACGDLGGAGLADHDCDETRQDVHVVTALVADATCGDVGDLGLADHHCDETAQDTQAVLGLADAAVCTEAGADLDCDGYLHHAEGLERDTARTAQRALKDAGL